VPGTVKVYSEIFASEYARTVKLLLLTRINFFENISVLIVGVYLNIPVLGCAEQIRKVLIIITGTRPKI
jgi:hypothetical protein